MIKKHILSAEPGKNMWTGFITHGVSSVTEDGLKLWGDPGSVCVCFCFLFNWHTHHRVNWRCENDPTDSPSAPARREHPHRENTPVTAGGVCARSADWTDLFISQNPALTKHTDSVQTPRQAHVRANWLNLTNKSNRLNKRTHPQLRSWAENYAVICITP